MSLYVVKNDKGEYWDFGADCWADPANYGSYASTSRDEVDSKASNEGGHVVELVEKPEPVEASEVDAARLEEIRKATCPWDTVDFYAGRNKEYANFLMRAYVLGYVVKKTKRYYVKVPCITGAPLYYMKEDGEIRAVHNITQPWQKPENKEQAQFTAAEIDQYGLGDCQKIEVDSDED